MFRTWVTGTVTTSSTYSRSRVEGGFLKGPSWSVETQHDTAASVKALVPSSPRRWGHLGSALSYVRSWLPAAGGS